MKERTEARSPFLVQSVVLVSQVVVVWASIRGECIRLSDLKEEKQDGFERVNATISESDLCMLVRRAIDGSKLD